ncbi:MAG TPA: hypothetical protein VN372_11475 [Methanospirillum sp.]|nr:hypothetical protein [Methanospirillum sp.]
MTLVTTSRRSSQDSRAIARDFAFALGAQYLARGKHGLRELGETDPSFFVVLQEDRSILLRWYQNGVPVLGREITKVENSRREGVMKRGIFTSDSELYQKLSRNHPVILEEQEKSNIWYDGPQRRHTVLTLKPVPVQTDI